VKLNNGAFGLQAYIVTYNGAKKNLQESKIMQNLIDDHIMERPLFRRYVVQQKMLCINAKTTSEIKKKGQDY
jgi:hypothetical protein